MAINDTFETEPGSDGPFVDLDSDQTINGQKIFGQGPYGTPVAMLGSEIDLTLGCVFSKTVSEDATLAISGAPSGTSAVFSLILTSGGSHVVTWPSNVLWNEDVPPDLSASGTDVLTFLTPDGGETWYCSVSLSEVTE